MKTIYCICFLLSALTELLVLPLERNIRKKKRTNDHPAGTCRIIIDKSDFELKVYDQEGLYAVYPVVFGKEPERDKFKAGDRRTPEGSFIIQRKGKHARWHKMLMLNYPTAESMEKYRRRIREGKITDTAKGIGGGIGIHGTEPGSDQLVDKFRNWTDGCISLKNKHIDDLYAYIQQGTKVVIRK
jgi:murein L,D-transpeptidase YafK